MTILMSDGISLLSGAMFDYNNPEDSDVTIEDIATALSNVCRFSGHVQYFYSVAQHVVNTSYLVSDEHAFTALMHDTAEAFTNDLPTPLKAAFPIFKELEVRIESAMSKKFKFMYPYPSEIKYADSQMLLMEKLVVKGDQSHRDCLDGVDVTNAWAKVDLDPMSAPEAKELFLTRVYELYPDKVFYDKHMVAA